MNEGLVLIALVGIVLLTAYVAYWGFLQDDAPWRLEDEDEPDEVYSMLAQHGRVFRGGGRGDD